MKKKRNHISMKTVFKVVFINFLIIWLFITNWDMSRTVRSEELNNINGEIEFISFIEGDRSTATHINIVVNAVTYKLFDMSGYEKINIQNIYNNLHLGDYVNLTYKPEIRLIFYRNAIIDLTINGVSYQTIDDYNIFHEGASEFWIVLFVIAEIVNLFVSFFNLFVYFWTSNGKISKFIDKAIFNKKSHKKKGCNQSGDG